MNEVAERIVALEKRIVQLEKKTEEVKNSGGILSDGQLEDVKKGIVCGEIDLKVGYDILCSEREYRNEQQIDKTSRSDLDVCSDGFVHWISVKDGLPPKPRWEGFMLSVVVLVGKDHWVFLAEWDGKSFYPTAPRISKCVYEDVTHWAILLTGNPLPRKSVYYERNS